MPVMYSLAFVDGSHDPQYVRLIDGQGLSFTLSEKDSILFPTADDAEKFGLMVETLYDDLSGRIFSIRPVSLTDE